MRSSPAPGPPRAAAARPTCYGVGGLKGDRNEPIKNGNSFFAVNGKLQGSTLDYPGNGAPVLSFEPPTVEG